MNSTYRSLLVLVIAALTQLVLAACRPAAAPGPVRSPKAQQWLDRAETSYRKADFPDAEDAITEALRIAPKDREIRLLAGRLALAKLDYPRAITMTQGDEGSEAQAIRGRAHWYSGNVAAAGGELDKLLRDPEVHDPWAKAISGLAHRGVGRKPYHATGSIVAAVEMPRVRGSALVVPVEIDGEQGLAMIATGTAEVVLDRAQRRDPSWVSMRFAGRVEYHDVPAITQDLSGISRQLGAPIKALLGVNFLRRGNVTFDFQGHQFVVRRFLPPRPPEATDVTAHYIRGGGMLVRSAVRSDTSSPLAALMIDTSLTFPMALDPDGWRKAGVDPSTLTPLPGEPSIKQGVVPVLRLGAFDIPQISAVQGADIAGLERALGLDLDGVIGSGLLAHYRVTIGEGGRVLWIEDEVVEWKPTEAPSAPTPPALGQPGTVLPPPSQPPTITP